MRWRKRVEGLACFGRSERVHGIDIAEHVISQRSWGAPDSYGEAFRTLVRHGILRPELAEQMVAAAGMRNAIMHEYDDIDWKRVHAALVDLSRIREFLAAVQAQP